MDLQFRLVAEPGIIPHRHLWTFAMKRVFSKFFFPILLICGATAFGYFGMPIQMGLFIAACALAMAFANIDRFESFKGAGFEAKIVKATEASALEQHQKVLLDALQQMSVHRTRPIGGEDSSSAPPRSLEDLSSNFARERLAQISDSRYISVDISTLDGRRGEWKFLPEDFVTIGDLLDEVFLILPRVSPFSYGKQWLLMDKNSSKVLLGLDRLGPVGLDAAGIHPGMKLAVVKP